MLSLRGQLVAESETSENAHCRIANDRVVYPFVTHEKPQMLS